jgi:serine protease Do
MRLWRLLGRLGVVAGLSSALSGAPAGTQIPDLNTGRAPTLAPLIREVTLAVVNIAVQSRCGRTIRFTRIRCFANSSMSR